MAQNGFTRARKARRSSPRAPARDETFYACTACHGFSAGGAAGHDARAVGDSINLMIRRHNMPPLADKDREDGAELSRGAPIRRGRLRQGRLGKPVCEVNAWK